jgi:hypothetical protein
VFGLKGLLVTTLSALCIFMFFCERAESVPEQLVVGAKLTDGASGAAVKKAQGATVCCEFSLVAFDTWNNHSLRSYHRAGAKRLLKQCMRLLVFAPSRSDMLSGLGRQKISFDE